jgi:hypothetical protein
MNPLIEKILNKEINRQKHTIELIASENFASQAVMDLCGSVFTNKLKRWLFKNSKTYTVASLLMFNHTRVLMLIQQCIKHSSSQVIQYLEWI